MAKKKLNLDKEIENAAKEFFAVGGEVTGGQPQIEEFIQQSKINLAKAKIEASQDPLVRGLKTASVLAGTYASIMGSSGNSSIEAKPTSLSLANTKASDIKLDIPLSDFDYSSIGNIEKHAVGGEVVNKKQEVEGGEIIEEPGQEAIKIKGPSHEQGGVAADLQPGTEIFSKRVKGPDGKTMAERKELRDKKRKGLTKLMEKAPFDKIDSDSVKRSLQNLEIEEKQDVTYMMQLKEALEAMEEEKQAVQQLEEVGEPQEFALGGLIEGAKKVWDSIYGFADKKGLPFLKENAGNILQGYGRYKSWSGTKDVIENMRASDTPRKNMYEHVGEGFEDIFSAQEQNLQRINKQTQKEIDKQVNAAKALNRARTRGLNSLKALDLSVDSLGFKQKDKAMEQFLANLNNLLAQKAKTKLSINEMKAKGAQIADEGNRADNDAYFNALAVNAADKGELISTFGRDINAITSDKRRAKLIGLLSSKHGIKLTDRGYLDKNGNIVPMEDIEKLIND